MKKQITVLLLALIAASSFVEIQGARPGRPGWGGGRGRGGRYYGRGWRGRGSGWRRWGWGGPYWGVGVNVGRPVVVVRDKYQDFVDNRGHTWWQITNNTPNQIIIEGASGGASINLPSGGSGQLDRGNSFTFTIRDQFGQTKTFDTQDHHVNINMSRNGEIFMKSW